MYRLGSFWGWEYTTFLSFTLTQEFRATVPLMNSCCACTCSATSTSRSTPRSRPVLPTLARIFCRRGWKIRPREQNFGLLVIVFLKNIWTVWNHFWPIIVVKMQKKIQNLNSLFSVENDLNKFRTFFLLFLGKLFWRSLTLSCKLAFLTSPVEFWSRNIRPLATIIQAKVKTCKKKVACQVKYLQIYIVFKM